jgi:hypothetical protein
LSVATDVRPNFTRALFISRPILRCLYSLPQATERKLTAAELDELRRKNALVIQKERKKEEQTRKYGAPIGQAFL